MQCGIREVSRFVEHTPAVLESAFGSRMISWQYRPPFFSYFCCLNCSPVPDLSCVTRFSIPFSRSCRRKFLALIAKTTSELNSRAAGGSWCFLGSDRCSVGNAKRNVGHDRQP